MKYIIYICLLFVSNLAKSTVLECETHSSVEEVIKCAESGEAFSQYNLGVMYRDGIKVSQNSEKAFYWLKRAAEQNMVEAETNLGQLYKLGVGTETNSLEAFKWTNKAAQKGFLPAINNLASLYFSGIGVNKDVSQAFHLYEFAAEKGFSDAQFNLSMLYLRGIGVPKNSKLAIYWMNASALQNNISAMAWLGLYYRDEKQFDESLRWTLAAAKRGSPLAQANLGYLYAMGEGVPANSEKANFWLSKAIEQNDAQAFLIIGRLYELGSDLFKVDKNKAFNFYLKAAELGDGVAQNNIATLLINGKGVNKDELKALAWYLKSAEEHNISEAMYSLHQIYGKGIGKIPQDLEKSHYWLEKAKENGFVPPK